MKKRQKMPQRKDDKNTTEKDDRNANKNRWNSDKEEYFERATKKTKKGDKNWDKNSNKRCKMFLISRREIRILQLSSAPWLTTNNKHSSQLR